MVRYALILHLAGLVAVDILLLPLTLVAFTVGFWRSASLKRAIRRELVDGVPAVDGGSLHYFGTLAWCLTGAFADLALAPLILAACMLGFWRATPLRASLRQLAGSSSSAPPPSEESGGLVPYLPALFAALGLASLDVVTLPPTAFACAFPKRGAPLRQALANDLGIGSSDGAVSSAGAQSEIPVAVAQGAAMLPLDQRQPTLDENGFADARSTPQGGAAEDPSVLPSAPPANDSTEGGSGDGGDDGLKERRASSSGVGATSVPGTGALSPLLLPEVAHVVARASAPGGGDASTASVFTCAHEGCGFSGSFEAVDMHEATCRHRSSSSSSSSSRRRHDYFMSTDRRSEARRHRRQFRTTDDGSCCGSGPVSTMAMDAFARHFELTGALCLIAVDVLCWPFAIVVYASHLGCDLRLKDHAQIVKTWPDQQWSGPSMAWNSRVISLFFLFLHDILLLPVALLVVALTCYRWPIVGKELKLATKNLRVSVGCGEERDQAPLTPRTAAAADDENWDRTREVAWQQFFECLLDLPFALLGLVIVVTCWRRQVLLRDVRSENRLSSMQRRCIVTRHFCLLLVDLMALPFFIVEVITLYRLPSVLGKLASRYAVPLDGRPLLVPLSVAATFPEEAGKCPRLRITGKLPAALKLVGPCQMHVLGEGFWNDLKRSLGSAAEVAKGFLPLNLSSGFTPTGTKGFNAKFDLDLVVADRAAAAAKSPAPYAAAEEAHDEFGVFGTDGSKVVTVEITIRKLKRRTIARKLAALRGEVTLLLQIETSGVNGTGERRIALAMPVTVGALQTTLGAAQTANNSHAAAASEDGVKWVPLMMAGSGSPEALEEAVAACRGDPSQHKGVVESFSLTVAVEFLELLMGIGDLMCWLLKAITHILVMLLCCCAPWRLLEFLVACCEPRRRFPARRLARAVATLDHTDGALVRFRQMLLPHLNACAKLMSGEGGPLIVGEKVKFVSRGFHYGERGKVAAVLRDGNVVVRRKGKRGRGRYWWWCWEPERYLVLTLLRCTIPGKFWGYHEPVTCVKGSVKRASEVAKDVFELPESSRNAFEVRGVLL